jgi:hypothetical protein
MLCSEDNVFDAKACIKMHNKEYIQMTGHKFLCFEMNLQFERLFIQSALIVERKAIEEIEVFLSRWKSKCRNSGYICQNAMQFHAKSGHGNRKDVGGSQPLYCACNRKKGHHKAKCFKLVRINEGHDNGNDNIRSCSCVAFSLVSQLSEFSEIIWVSENGALCHGCNNFYPMSWYFERKSR